MPFRRKFQKRGRKGAMRRRRAGGRFMNRRGFASKYHAPKHFTEVIQLGAVVSPASGSAGQGYNYPIQGTQLQNLANSLIDVYKQYVITGVKLMYLPAYNTYPLVAGVAMIPKLYYAEDKSSFSVPLVAGQMMQQDNLKIFDSSKKWTHFIKNPRPWLTQFLGNSSNETPAIPPAKAIQWLTTDDIAGADTSGLGVQHLHSAMFIEPNNSNVAVTTGVLWARVYYACKEQR